MNSITKSFLVLALVMTLLSSSVSAQLNYKSLEGFIKGCGLRVVSKKYEPSTDQLIIETAGTKAFGRGNFIAQPFDKSIARDAYDLVDSLLVGRLAGSEVISSSRAAKPYGALYTYHVKPATGEDTYVHRFIICTYRDETVLFGYTAMIKRSWGLLERFECIVRRLQ